MARKEEDWSNTVGLTTARQWAELEKLKDSRINIREDLTEVERELGNRIDKVVDLAQRQAEDNYRLLCRIEGLEKAAAELRAQIDKHGETLYGTDEGKLGLVVEFRFAKRVAWWIRGVVSALVALGAFAFKQGWIK